MGIKNIAENMTQDIVGMLHITNKSVLMDLEYLVYVNSCAVWCQTKEGQTN